MRVHRSRWPWVIWAAVVACLVPTMLLTVRGGSLEEEPYFIPIAVMMILGYSTVGAILATRTRRNPIGWLLLLVGVLFVLTGLSDEYLQSAEATGRLGDPLVPYVALVTVISLVLPFAVTILVPAIAGQRLSADMDLVRISAVVDPARELTPDVRVQLFLFQQFMTLFLLTPITGAMALAAHSVVGEKQARTLEPLLAAPVGTLQLLVAKVVGSLLPHRCASATLAWRPRSICDS